MLDKKEALILRAHFSMSVHWNANGSVLDTVLFRVYILHMNIYPYTKPNKGTAQMYAFAMLVQSGKGNQHFSERQSMLSIQLYIHMSYVWLVFFLDLQSSLTCLEYKIDHNAK